MDSDIPDEDVESFAEDLSLFDDTWDAEPFDLGEISIPVNADDMEEYLFG